MTVLTKKVQCVSATAYYSHVLDYFQAKVTFFALMSVIFTSVVNLLQVFTQIILTFIIKNSNVLTQ